MLPRLFLVISLLSLCFFLYGVLFRIWEIEENACQMTYMFEYPQFVRVHFKENDNFPKYELYAYSEGQLTAKARSMVFTGAPVIFIPGNSGSYKQARSLASVALRKGLENDRKQHIDYFTISYNEEYSALFGGFLDDQKEFLKQSILTVLNLYEKVERRPEQVILIGHSMGGKIAQSILVEPEMGHLINTVIAISTPIDQPVVNLDFHFEAFYRKTDKYLLENMKTNMPSNTTNYCMNQLPTELQSTPEKGSPLDHVLFITIGGGNRDVLVRSGLTHSKYADIHVLATSIPNVWLTTDHLCAVWCLQFVLVINRFLYSILTPPPKGRLSHLSGQTFLLDKSTRLVNAKHFFVKPFRQIRHREMNLVQRSPDTDNWVEESRRVYSEYYSDGLTRTKVNMIRLVDQLQYKMLTVEAVNIDSDDWVFGCSAIETYNNMRYCSKATSLSHLVMNLPSIKQKRQFLRLDLHKIKRTNTSWTHVLLRIPPTREKVQLNVDIHDPAVREINVKMPKWYSYSTVNLLSDTILGSSFYQLKISNLEESHPVLALYIKPRVCSRPVNHAVAELCIPWTRGCSRYQYFTHEKNLPMYIYATNMKPVGYNTTENPILVNLHLDPACRYTISVQNSFGGTMSRIVQQYFHWLLAHLTAVLFLALKHQLSLTPAKAIFKCGKLHSALLSCSSFFIITATRLFAKLLMNFTSLPNPDDFHQSMMVSIILHGSALSILSISTAGMWLAVCFWGNAVHSILVKMLRLPLPTIISSCIRLLRLPLPISLAIAVLITIAYSSCSGIALICAAIFYFIHITKQYEEYLEEFVHKTIKMIAEKLFGSKRTEGAEQEESKNQSDKNTSDNKDGDNVKEVEVKSLEIEKKDNSMLDEDETEASKTMSSTVVENKDASDNSENEEDESDCDPIDDLSDLETKSAEELDELLKEAFEKHKKMNEQTKENRKEYDAIHEGLSSLNFHMTMFFLLAVASIINIPSTISWAKNVHFSPKLSPDPSLFPATVILFSCAILWQFKTPRNLYGYQVISSILYVCAAICIIYCQDSVYRLNSIISTIFGFIAIHQIFGPKKPEEKVEDKSDEDLLQKINDFKKTLLHEDNATLPTDAL